MPGLFRQGLLSKAAGFAVTARSSQLQVDAMLLCAALLRVPKEKREAVAKHVGDWKDIHSAIEKMAVHSICGDWKSPKSHAEAIKAASSTLRAAKTLPGAEPGAGWLLKAKVKAKVTEAAKGLFAGDSNRLVGCLRELLALVGVDAKQFQASKKGGSREKDAEGKASKEGKKRPAAGKGSDRDEEDEEDMSDDDLLASDNEDDEISGGDSDDGDAEQPKTKAKGKAKRDKKSDKGRPTEKHQKREKASKKPRKG